MDLVSLRVTSFFPFWGLFVDRTVCDLGGSDYCLCGMEKTGV